LLSDNINLITSWRWYAQWHRDRMIDPPFGFETPPLSEPPMIHRIARDLVQCRYFFWSDFWQVR